MDLICLKFNLIFFSKFKIKSLRLYINYSNWKGGWQGEVFHMCLPLYYWKPEILTLFIRIFIIIIIIFTFKLFFFFFIKNKNYFFAKFLWGEISCILNFNFFWKIENKFNFCCLMNENKKPFSVSSKCQYSYSTYRSSLENFRGFLKV